MSTKCRKSDSDSGVYVEAYSGVGRSDVCTLNSRTDVKHIVTIQNLLLYDATISCEGIISSVPRQVEFSGTQFNVTPGHWRVSGSDLPEAEQRTFDQIYLKGVGSGSEFVRAKVDVNWPEPNQNSNLSVAISVTV